MSRKNIRYARGFLVTQINHWTFFPILMLFFGVAKRISTFGDPSLLLWLEVGVLPVLYFVFRMKTRHFWMLLASHVTAAVLLGALLVLQSPSSGWVYVTGAGCYVIYSILHRLSGENLQDGKVSMPASVGISAVSLFVLHSQGYAEWDTWYIAALIAVFAMYFLSTYLEHYLNFLAVNESSAGHLPEREIFFSGSQMAVLYVLFAVLVLFLTSGFGWLRSILAVAREFIFDLLRALLSGIHSGEQEFAAAEMVKQSRVDSMELPEAGEPLLLWEILEVVAEAAFLCGILYVVIRLLLRLPAFIRERMGRGRMLQNGASEGKVFDVRERCGIEKPGKMRDRRNPFAFLSMEERIRRLYKRHILSAGSAKNHGNTDPSKLTAREWGTRLKQEELAAPYEKARYSGVSCTSEDLRAMKSACR